MSNEALQLLNEVDIQISPRGEGKLSVPKGLPPETLEKIKALKPQLLQLLLQPKPKPKDPAPEPEPLPPAAVIEPVNNPEPDSQLPTPDLPPVCYQEPELVPLIPVEVAEHIRNWERQLRPMGWSHEEIWKLATILNMFDVITHATFNAVWINFRDGRGTLRIGKGDYDGK